MPFRLKPSIGIGAGAVVAVCVVGAWLALRGGDAPVARAQQTDGKSSVDIARQIVEVTEQQAAGFAVAPADSREFKVLKNAVGSIDFNQNMLVQAFTPNAGRIVDTYYNVGDEVKKGEPLFTIDSPDLLNAESNLLATAGVLELQTRTLNRVKQLLKAGGGAQKDVDQATSDQQTAEGNFKAARDAVRIFGKSEAEIDRILNDRKVDSILIVPSPITGRIISRNAAPGLYVQPGAAPAPYALADISTMWMIANVIESDAPAYKLGQAVEVRVPAYPDTVFRGRVSTLGLNIDPGSHRQLVRSVIDDPQHLLRAGMLARFTIEVAAPQQSPAVPLAAIVREGDGTMTVWVTSDRRRFARRTVKIGLEQDGFRQVVEGLNPGELIATTGAIFLSNKFATAVTG
ncbi:efflux RND transporter periplasmic adaptor subunit [Bradyrhizobium sp. U87765 SZCCT0131]|uniref:efflux RND transporter periplasmic adaptor subunit n=1 Tax=unclassified Bradyrhizobium TaxID=2631580 RepID=UPI001BA663BB|nr:MULTISPECIES: efflux RND transporter periplasmic adaptor subunit [unclassified Bradyrhizobium]MBR1219125.1 efflux RND transporter periplasmic adaptor subunit [Bradyrhizobium sp. U87765 SZCCT0131]MBR1261776.1 efflux RND transporter periplasmic adaptor subunit [Bradyrhizobium sp. U87765 SZCCT0134]MBR1306371.1 efflux RND transporter periplasmic adaptor subunit [Bradyrhizobium sp. U87765 SZCCT0110]MBR1317558.1 efflux RND transporter periplasmic adaptor subunit [Bradyrhizobium sp. U87765 SZCCT010